MKGTHKQADASLQRFDDDRYLSQSEESKCMCTHGKDGAIHSHTFLIEKEISDRQNFAVKFPCIYVCLSSVDLFIFRYEFPLFFFLLIFVLTILRYFPFIGDLI